MKKIISVFLAAVVCASMFAVPVFGAFAEETSSVPDLDDPEQRLAYECLLFRANFRAKGSSILPRTMLQSHCLPAEQ